MRSKIAAYWVMRLGQVVCAIPTVTALGRQNGEAVRLPAQTLLQLSDAPDGVPKAGMIAYSPLLVSHSDLVVGHEKGS